MRLDEVAADSDHKRQSVTKDNASKHSRGRAKTDQKPPIKYEVNAGNGAMSDALAAAFGKNANILQVAININGSNKFITSRS